VGWRLLPGRRSAAGSDNPPLSHGWLLMARDFTSAGPALTITHNCPRTDDMRPLAASGPELLTGRNHAAGNGKPCGFRMASGQGIIRLPGPLPGTAVGTRHASLT